MLPKLNIYKCNNILLEVSHHDTVTQNFDNRTVG